MTAQEKQDCAIYLAAQGNGERIWAVDMDADTGEPVRVRYDGNPAVGVASISSGLGVVSAGRRGKAAAAALARARKEWTRLTGKAAGVIIFCLFVFSGCEARLQLESRPTAQESPATSETAPLFPAGGSSGESPTAQRTPAPGECCVTCQARQVCGTVVSVSCGTCKAVEP